MKKSIEELDKKEKEKIQKNADFLHEKISGVIKNLKKLQKDLKNNENIQEIMNATLKAMALRNCLREYEFHYEFMIKDMEKNGIIERVN